MNGFGEQDVLLAIASILTVILSSTLGSLLLKQKVESGSVLLIVLGVWGLRVMPIVVGLSGGNYYVAVAVMMVFFGMVFPKFSAGGIDQGELIYATQVPMILAFLMVNTPWGGTILALCMRIVDVLSGVSAFADLRSFIGG